MACRRSFGGCDDMVYQLPWLSFWQESDAADPDGTSWVGVPWMQFVVRCIGGAFDRRGK